MELIYVILSTTFMLHYVAAQGSDVTTIKPKYLVEPLKIPYTESAGCLHWCVETQNLFYTDRHSGKLLRYDYKADRIYSCQIENIRSTGFVVPLENSTNTFVVQWPNGLKDTTCIVKGSFYEAQTERPEIEAKRFNVGKCDPLGRLYAGTTRGEVYAFEKGCKELLKFDVGIVNGLAWNENLQKLYILDSVRFELKEYDYDLESSTASNSKVLYNFRNANETLSPAGLTVDTDGSVYVAISNANTVYMICPVSRQIEQKIKLPVKGITSVAFGGPNLDILFVSTSRRVGEQDPAAGSIYKVTGLGAKGSRMAKVIV